MIGSKYWPVRVLIGYFLLLMFVVGFGFYCMTLLVVPVSQELGISDAKFSNVYLFCSIGSGLSTLILYRYQEKMSLRLFAIIGGCISFLGYWIFYRCSYLAEICISGALIGASTVVAGSALMQFGLSRWFWKRRGLALGIAGAATGVGTAIGGPLMGKLIVQIGWRNACLAAGGLIFFVTAIAVVFLIRSSPEDCRVMPYGADDGTSCSETRKQELQTGKTVSQAMCMPRFWIMILSILLATMVYEIVSLYQSPIIQSRGFTLEQASYCLSVFAVSNMLNKLISGAMIDRFGFRLVSTYSAIACMIAIVAVLCKNALWTMVLFSFLFGTWPSIVTVEGLFVGTFLLGSKNEASWITIGQISLCLGGAFGPLLIQSAVQSGSGYNRLLSILLVLLAVCVSVTYAMLAPKYAYRDNR